MKPFNLDQASAGKPVVNGRGERVVDFYCFADADGDCCLAVLFENYQKPLLYSDAGVVYDETGMAGDERNLYMATTKRTVWVVVMENAINNLQSSGYLYKDIGCAIADSKEVGFPNRLVGVFPLEIEE